MGMAPPDSTLTACGRFAPSPTGPLHFGSLVAALGSYFEARTRGGGGGGGGRWLVRMEDVDAPRCKQVHADSILRTLAACGFEWDGAVLYQSTRTERYREALDQLKQAGASYPCGCTRAELADAPQGVDGAPVYPGTCSAGLPPGRIARAWRLRVAESIDFDDAVQGRQYQNLSRDVGDCVLLRADGYFAYQLAVVVDDADQGVDHVVRGADLIHSTARQIALQRRLGLPTPAYAHLPVVVDENGQKLSKQTLAAPVDTNDPVPALFAAAAFLGQNPPEEFRRALRHPTSADFFAWAQAHWSLDKVPRRASQPIEKEHTA
jgi:glutamyl-Q tRNA(Asp) synthetase